MPQHDRRLDCEEYATLTELLNHLADLLEIPPTGWPKGFIPDGPRFPREGTHRSFQITQDLWTTLKSFEEFFIAQHIIIPPLGRFMTRRQIKTIRRRAQRFLKDHFVQNPKLGGFILRLPVRS